jgi:hypothetical protein
MPDYKKTQQQFKDLDIYMFKNTPFEDPLQEIITPKFEIDRSYRDNLEASHINR